MSEFDLSNVNYNPNQPLVNFPKGNININKADFTPEVQEALIRSAIGGGESVYDAAWKEAHKLADEHAIRQNEQLQQRAIYENEQKQQREQYNQQMQTAQQIANDPNKLRDYTRETFGLNQQPQTQQPIKSSGDDDFLSMFSKDNQQSQQQQPVSNDRDVNGQEQIYQSFTQESLKRGVDPKQVVNFIQQLQVGDFVDMFVAFNQAQQHQGQQQQYRQPQQPVQPQRSQPINLAEQSKVDASKVHTGGANFNYRPMTRYD